MAIKKIKQRRQETVEVEEKKGFVLINGRGAFHKETGRAMVAFITNCSANEMQVASRLGLHKGKPLLWMHDVNYPNMDIPSAEYNVGIGHCLRNAGHVATLAHYLAIWVSHPSNLGQHLMKEAGENYVSRALGLRAEVPAIVAAYDPNPQRTWASRGLSLLNEYRDKHRKLEANIDEQEGAIVGFEKKLRDIIVIDTIYVLLLGAVLYGIVWG